MRLTVLGGSTPFTLPLVDALLARADELPRLELALFGRDPAALEAVAFEARRCSRESGWSVRTETDLEAALDGADRIVQQIRFGGLEGREADELFAARCGCVADETLGPAGLRCLLRTAGSLRDLGRRIAERAPEAWVLQLTNPLSAATSLLSGCGVSRQIGICELPETSAREAARRLGVGFDEVAWDYEGLNHRGLLTGFHVEGRSRLDELCGLPWIEDPGAIAELGAVPMKYHALLRDDPAQTAVARDHGAGRAKILARMRRQALDALEMNPPDPHAARSILTGRNTEWYAEGVVPLLIALSSEVPQVRIVNTPGSDGLTRERRALVSSRGVTDYASSARGEFTRPSTRGRAELDRFERHERAVLELLEAPDRDRLRRAVEADPVVPAERVRDVCVALESEGCLDAARRGLEPHPIP